MGSVTLLRYYGRCRLSKYLFHNSGIPIFIFNANHIWNISIALKTNLLPHIHNLYDMNILIELEMPNKKYVCIQNSVIVIDTTLIAILKKTRWVCNTLMEFISLYDNIKSACVNCFAFYEKFWGGCANSEAKTKRNQK